MMGMNKTSKVGVLGLVTLLSAVAFAAKPQPHPQNDISVRMPKSIVLKGEPIPVWATTDGNAVGKYYTVALEDGKKIDCEIYFVDGLAASFLGKAKHSKLAKDAKSETFVFPSKDAARLWSVLTKENLDISSVKLVMVEGDARKPAGLKPNYLIDVVGSKHVKGMACHAESPLSAPSRGNATGAQHQWQPGDFIDAGLFDAALGSK